MKIVIFGATGRTGIPLVQQSLEANHEVVAFVRTPQKLAIKHPNLHLYQGDAMNPADVESAIIGTDAVLSVIGHTRNTPHNMQTIATENIVSNMQKHGVKRLISLTGAALKDPKDSPKFIDRAIKLMMRLVAGHVLEDAENHATIIKKSGLDWVIVRGPRLTEGAYTGNYRVGWVGKDSGTQVSRADIADFMLKQLTSDEYLYQMPMISY